MDSTRRFPGGAASLLSAPGLSGRDRVVIPACIAVLTLLAWTYLIHLSREMSASMAYDRQMAAMGMTMNRPWTATDILLTFAMWAVMMVGMMAGSVMPMLLLFSRAQAGRGRTGASFEVLSFGLGYFMVWAGFSLCATLAQWALHQAALLSPSMNTSNQKLAGVILLTAGVYQLTPWKGKCLNHCRSPLGFLMTNWQDGKSGAVRMGVRHGVHCLGCCWALMCVLFAVGVMNLVWVAVLTVLVLLEKIGPAGVMVARLAGGACAIRGIFLIAFGS